MDYKQLDEILSSHGRRKEALIPIMQEVQKQNRYLPEEALRYIARELALSPARVYSVATFYENFSMSPKGRYVIRVCDGTACHVRKSIPILEALREELELSATKHTTDDKLFTVETVSCLGACGLAPVLTVNDHVHAAMTPDSTRELLAALRREIEEDAQ